MILQALNEYYNRLRNDPQIDIPEPGFSVQKTTHAIVLDQSGNLIRFEDLRSYEGQRAFPKLLNVPKPLGERSGKNPPSYLTWDKSKYVLGVELDKQEVVATPAAFQNFTERHRRLLSGIDDPAARAILGFLENWNPDSVRDYVGYEDVLAGGFLVFKFDGEKGFFHEKDAIHQVWLTEYLNDSSKILGQCLVTGEKNSAIARIHPQLKGIAGAQTAGAALVGFNDTAYESYSKKQSFNAPVSEQVAFAYTTALNQLLVRNSLQKVQIGDATTVFWTGRASPMEGLMAGLLDPGILDNAPDELRNDLRIFLESVSRGQFPRAFGRPDNRFYVLGLSPNAARISVRFWHVSTVGEIADHIGRHYRDLAIVKNFDNEPDHPSLWQILRETAAQRDSRNIAPVLAGQAIRAILVGTAYPRTILTSLVGRMRADRQINYIRTAMLKAFLIRNLKEEVTMLLDTDSNDQAYRLGRLFAVMEKAQEEAVSGANTTIKDRFFGAASAMPARVFPILLRGVQNNIAKLRKGSETTGRAVYFDRSIAEIMEGIDAFPPTLRLEDQGMFAIGYYHQRKDLFTKKTTTKSKEG